VARRTRRRSARRITEHDLNRASSDEVQDRIAKTVANQGKGCLVVLVAVVWEFARRRGI
jgi:hypothetical protein